jgi:hypothetical protein
MPVVHVNVWEGFGNVIFVDLSRSFAIMGFFNPAFIHSSQEKTMDTTRLNGPL